MSKECIICGRKFRRFVLFGGVKESVKEGVCEICLADEADAKKVKKEKRKKEKLKRAWLYGKR
jgi:hypothetical protein